MNVHFRPHTDFVESVKPFIHKVKHVHVNKTLYFYTATCAFVSQCVS